jgi:hypothetical protein
LEFGEEAVNHMVYNSGTAAVSGVDFTLESE